MSTTQDLLKMVQEMAGISDEEASQVNYKYVIYVRKSTESEERQTRSLGDQIKECKDLAQRFGLNVVKIFKESESAKEPDIRPVFREMINRIKAGKYDGIISWHPDRLSRNMKEAGEVIDLIDKSIIKDLQFVSFTFQNNASGKMLLGIAFVLSKQYSDQLSANVKRGIKRSIEDGKAFNRPKHGYFKDRNFYLRPDGANFLLMKHAWKLRAEHKQLTEIAEYLNNNAYQRAYFEGKHEEFKMNKKKLSEIFSDTTYAGVMKYGEKNTVDLTQVYDFIPMVTVDEFLKINKTDTINKFFKLRDRNKTDVQATLCAVESFVVNAVSL